MSAFSDYNKVCDKLQVLFSNSENLSKLNREAMNLTGFRTDIAAEDLPRDGGELPGVRSGIQNRDGFQVTTVEVMNDAGAKKLCKPIGTYITMDLDSFFRREEDSFPRAALLLARFISDLLPLKEEASVLVAGLGNPAITPDAIGPQTAQFTLATRHLKERMPDDFSAFRPVSVCQTGVLGTTGMESAELVRAIQSAAAPDAVVVVDALAARESDRLCRTVQLTDSGIVPGSGVGNDRAELSRKTLSIPVLAIGVPTVVDAGDGLIVTPRDIDRYVKDAGKLIAYALNLAFHPALTVSDVDMFVG